MAAVAASFGFFKKTLPTHAGRAIGSASGCVRERGLGFGLGHRLGLTKKSRQPTCTAELAFGDADQGVPFALTVAVAALAGDRFS